MSDPLENRRKRLRFRSRHRGTKELDLIIGGFADRYLAGFEEAQLDRFERLLDIPEPLVYDWLFGRGAPPPELDHDVMRLLLAFEYPKPNDSSA